jgi:single stranded DNA-binding protein (ssb)
MVNSAVLQGRLVRDPELRTTQSGVAVASFTVAWSEKYKDTETQCFLDCTAWRGTGEFVSKYFSKGKEILVQGRLETQKWVDNDGNNRSKIQLVADKVHFCGTKSDGGDTSNTYQAASAPVDVTFDEMEDDGELPF